MLKHLLALILPAALLASPAAAQTSSGSSQNQTGTGNPAMTAPGSTARQPNQADRTFFRAAALGGMAEVDLAKLAEQRGQSDAVKHFAQRMIEDHGKANDRLAALAKDAGVKLPSALDQERQAGRARLEKATGAAFDQAYMENQMAEHVKTAQLFAYVIGSGQDAALKAFAVETLPVVLEHLQLAQSINAEMTGAMARASTSGSGTSATPQQ